MNDITTSKNPMRTFSSVLKRSWVVLSLDMYFSWSFSTPSGHFSHLNIEILRHFRVFVTQNTMKSEIFMKLSMFERRYQAEGVEVALQKYTSLESTYQVCFKTLLNVLIGFLEAVISFRKDRGIWDLASKKPAGGHFRLICYKHRYSGMSNDWVSDYLFWNIIK